MSTKVELSRTAIVDRALHIADGEGIAAITVRRLAQEFGVTPMALYWHVANKDELLAAMGRRFFDDLEVSSNGDWSDRLRSAVDALVTSMRRHPGAAHLVPPQTLQCEAGLELTELTLASLCAEGFPIRQAADIARSAMQTATMLVVDQAGAEVGVACDERAGVVAAKHQAIANLPADRYPNLVLCADALTTVDDEESYFRFGVDLFISGVEQLHPGAGRPARAKAQSTP